MLFFEQHFTKHNLFHAPHKWFLALLASPIHYLELYYKKKYHLRYENAHKLFTFDLIILCSILILTGTTIFWFFFNPTITNFINVSLKISPDKIRSGDYISLTINYQNGSKKTIVDASLAIRLPSSFIIDTVEPSNKFSPTDHTFNFGKLTGGANGKTVINGWFFGKPDKDHHLEAQFSYRQEDQNFTETKSARLIATLRGSVLEGTIESAPEILSPGSSPLKIQLVNHGNREIPKITLLLKQKDGLKIEDAFSTSGTTTLNSWQIDSLKPNESVELTANLIANLTNQTNNADIILNPLITINDEKIEQTSFKRSLSVIRPQVEFVANWTDTSLKSHAGDTKNLEIILKNTGTINLENLIIELPLSPSLINISNTTALNHSKYNDGLLSLNKNYFAQLESLKKGQTAKIELPVMIAENPQGGMDLLLKLTPRLKASIPNLKNAIYETTTESQGLKIGSKPILTAEVRYYTPEGDQLGRGPLPPQVGKETKYWILIKLLNTTSELAKVNFNADLLPYVKWTDKSSVSMGKQINYNPTKNQVSWTINILQPYEKAGIYFEVSLTPQDNQRGETPIILKNIQFNGHDTFIDEDVSLTSPNLDVSMPTDDIAKQKGTIIQ